MRNHPLFLLGVGALLFLGGCQTQLGYQPAGSSELGYTSRAVEAQFLVAFAGTAAMDQQQVSDYALLRAAEVCRKENLPRFAVQSSTPGKAAAGPAAPGRPVGRTMTLIVDCFDQAPAAAARGQIFDAGQQASDLRTKYAKGGTPPADQAFDGRRGYGYVFRPIEARFEISFAGNRAMDSQQVSDFALLRAAEVCRENHLIQFVVQSRRPENRPSGMTVTLTVQCFDQAPAGMAREQVQEAYLVSSELRKKYGIGARPAGRVRSEGTNDESTAPDLRLPSHTPSSGVF